MMPGLSEVIARHRGYVRALLTRRGVIADRLDDAEQEVFLVLVRRQADFQPSSSYRRWLSGIARNVAAAERRRQCRPPMPCQLSAQPVDAERFDATLEATMLLGSLASAHREVWLAAQVGHTATEIAQRLELPLSTVQWRLREARRRLREAARAAGHRCRTVWLGWERWLGGVQRTAALSTVVAAVVGASTLAPALDDVHPRATPSPMTPVVASSSPAMTPPAPPPRPRPFAGPEFPTPVPPVPEPGVRIGTPTVRAARRPRAHVRVGEPTIAPSGPG